MVFLIIAVLTAPFWVPTALTGLAFVFGAVIGTVGSIAKVFSK